MSLRLKHVLLLIVGWAFILLGIAGLFLPILQGVLFLLIGLFILYAEYVWASSFGPIACWPSESRKPG